MRVSSRKGKRVFVVKCNREARQSRMQSYMEAFMNWNNKTGKERNSYGSDEL